MARAAREHPGLLRKRENRLIAGLSSGAGLFADAAVEALGDGFVAAACDAILPELCARAPRFAGRSAVLAAVNDLAAVGARPLFFVNALAAPDRAVLDELAGGMAEAAALFGVPCRGGHLLPLGTQAGVSVTAVGRASRRVSPGVLSEGDLVVLALCLDGRRPAAHALAWDATFCADPEAVRGRYRALESLFEAGLIRAAKDVANAGILGTLALLAEASGAGVAVDLDSVDRPTEMPFIDWLLSFLSFGFVLGVARQDEARVLETLFRAGVWARAVGTATGDGRVVLHSGDEEAVVFDWNVDSILRV